MESKHEETVWDENDCAAGIWTEEDLAVLKSSDVRIGKHISVGKYARRLQQQSRFDLLNYLYSIKQDSVYVSGQVALVQKENDLPVFANLRNGLWYVDPKILSGTCYFKSADGHSGQWAFSYSRLNLNVALAAARKSGCILVDSTRRGKSFPDSFTATVPIWCAVLNRIVANYSDDFEAGHFAEHFPPWLSPLEVREIEQKMAEFISGLGSSMTVIAAQLAPLLKRWLKPFWCAPSFPLSSIDRSKCTPIICVSASMALEHESERHRVSWQYIQGAGDDEESWSRGLTSAAFWANEEELLKQTTCEDARLLAKEIMSREEDGIPTAIKFAAEIYADLGGTGLSICSLSYLIRQTQNTYVDHSEQSVINLSCHAMNRSNALNFNPAKCRRSDWQDTILPQSLTHAYLSLVSQRKLLICCDYGNDSSVAIAVACLVSFELSNGIPSMRTGRISKETIRENFFLVQCWTEHSRPMRKYMKELSIFFVSAHGGWNSGKLHGKLPQANWYLF